MRWWSKLNVWGMLLVCGKGFLLGVGFYTFYFAEGASYLSNDPKVCVNCHIMRDEYDGWQKSSHHAAATCNDCHVPHDFAGKYATKIENGFLHSKAFTFQNFHEPIQIRQRSSRILRQNCLYCHKEFVSQTTIPFHKESDELTCVRCHQSVGHGPTE